MRVSSTSLSPSVSACIRFCVGVLVPASCVRAFVRASACECVRVGSSMCVLLLACVGVRVCATQGFTPRGTLGWYKRDIKGY